MLTCVFAQEKDYTLFKCVSLYNHGIFLSVNRDIDVNNKIIVPLFQYLDEKRSHSLKSVTNKTLFPVWYLKYTCTFKV